MELSGFFPSTNENPRRYGNDWVNKLLDRVISDGVFMTPQGTPSNDLQVIAGAGMSLTVMPGRGRFKCGDQTFTYENTSELMVTLENSTDITRTDYVVVRVDRNENVKNVFVLRKTGNKTTGEAPTLLDTAYQKEYVLAKITVGAGVTVISQSNISDRRGRETPWVTSLIQQVDTSTLMEQFDSAFWNWYDNVTKNISGTVMVVQRTAQYITQIANESTITIPTSLLYENGDMMTVYVEGRKFNEGIDYVINGNSIKLTNSLPVVGTDVDFDVLKNVDMTEAKSYLSQLVALENRVNASQITNNNGAPKITIQSNLISELMNLGIGVHTFYSPVGRTNNPRTTDAWNGVFFRTSNGIGWILTSSTNGDLYINSYNGGWVGWRVIYETSPTILYKSDAGIFMTAGTTITLNRRLNDCRNGWCLIWSKYVNGAAVNARYVTTFIPKTIGTGTVLSGQSFFLSLPVDVLPDGTFTTCVKVIYVGNNSITGDAVNELAENGKMCLRAVVEY